MEIHITTGAFNPWQAMQDWLERIGGEGRYGATACFVGSLRDYHDDARVSSMWLEHYPGMTEQHIQRIVSEATTRWSLLDVLVIHRVGEIAIGDSIVLIATCAGHRGDAFDACRHILEDLKHQAPFWKKERTADGEHWVESNTSGYASGE